MHGQHETVEHERRLDERSKPEKRTMKKKRLHTRLTELTQALLNGTDGREQVAASVA